MPGRRAQVNRSSVAAGRHQPRAANVREGIRRRVAEGEGAPPAVPALRWDAAHLRAAWAYEHGRRELVLRPTPPGLQVRQRSWLASGTLLEQVFVLRSRAEFDQWHANAPTKFGHPVAHDEIRRFAHGSLAQ
jgi:hypothetical protein